MEQKAPKTANAAGEPVSSDIRIAARVLLRPYVSAFLLCVFASALLFYVGYAVTSGIVLAGSAAVVTLLATTDKIVFDGRRIYRTGWIFRFWAARNGSANRLRLGQIEQVESSAVRSFRRGGRVTYRYQTAFRGRDREFIVSSGSRNYGRFVRAVLSLLNEDVLDIRSVEVRDYLVSPKALREKAAAFQIPATDVLQVSAVEKVRIGARSAEKEPNSLEKAGYLRRLANELRLSGYLLQAKEVFRRAALIDPFDGRLLYEFARCLQSISGLENDAKLRRRSIALLRLSERRAGIDAELLSRLGEMYSQAGEWGRARSVYERSIERFGESFRSLRGLSEIALRDGKIAHAIHHLSNAQKIARTPAVRRWTRNEAEYFGHLNDNEEYLDMEISRIGLLDTFNDLKQTALGTALAAIPLIPLGIALEMSLMTDIAWAVSGIGLSVRIVLGAAARLMTQRIPFELIEDEE